MTVRIPDAAAAQLTVQRDHAQGYSFKVVTQLVDDADATLQLSRRDERTALLAKLHAALAANEAEGGVEADADGDGLGTAKPAAVRRKKGTLADLSGADAYYREIDARPQKRSGGNLRKIVGGRGTR
jgi:hypothetical protein